MSLLRSLIFRTEISNELYNLRHAQYRNVVERIFGVLKMRYPILDKATWWPDEYQVKLVPALCALHNFIRVHDWDDMEAAVKIWDHEYANKPPEEVKSKQTYAEIAAESTQARELRDKRAEKMWK